jgi:hypothetical protein
MLFQKLVRPKPWPNQQTQLQEQEKGQEALIAAEPASGATIPRTEQSVPRTEQSVIQPKS